MKADTEIKGNRINLDDGMKRKGDKYATNMERKEDLKIVDK